LVVEKITEIDAVDKPDSKMEMVKSSLKNLNGGGGEVKGIYQVTIKTSMHLWKT
jgi:hypothetical protein